jgi:hypothetical protein
MATNESALDKRRKLRATEQALVFDAAIKLLTAFGWRKPRLSLEDAVKLARDTLTEVKRQNNGQPEGE